MVRLNLATVRPFSVNVAISVVDLGTGSNRTKTGTPSCPVHSRHLATYSGTKRPSMGDERRLKMADIASTRAGRSECNPGVLSRGFAKRAKPAVFTRRRGFPTGSWLPGDCAALAKPTTVAPIHRFPMGARIPPQAIRAGQQALAWQRRHLCGAMRNGRLAGIGQDGSQVGGR